VNLRGFVEVVKRTESRERERREETRKEGRKEGMRMNKEENRTRQRNNNNNNNNIPSSHNQNSRRRRFLPCNKTTLAIIFLHFQKISQLIKTLQALVRETQQVRTRIEGEERRSRGRERLSTFEQRRRGP
jgi:hypothetical protein